MKIHHLLNLITCCGKQHTPKQKAYKSKVYPIPIPSFTADESIVCSGCFNSFKLSDNQLSVNCAGCNKFFHCKIAGTCYGIKSNPCVFDSSNTLSWCIDCVPAIPENTINKDRRAKCICPYCLAS